MLKFFNIFKAGLNILFEFDDIFEPLDHLLRIIHLYSLCKDG